MTDDSDKTPARSPSAQHRLGLATCPVCHGEGKVPLGVVAGVATCSECDGGGRVTLKRHGELVGLKSINVHDTPVPPTEPDPKGAA